ncbi:MAG: amino acid adenylation domain-containing protein, partial [Acidobacteria bacterium]|nr:amino acid adenylation domain-containing protein [Acidobacteriota bacterium]
WLPAGGVIEFLGRIDQQVKIRGIRVEPGEIESQLKKIEMIKDAVVLVKQNTRKEKYLCAYIVGNHHYNESDARNILSIHLPNYMIPAHFVQIDKIPLTANGKIDRKSLPEPELKTSGNYVAPKNDIEIKLVELWVDVLQTSIGVNDNFFLWGGNSLKAILLLSKIHKNLNVKVPLAEIFKTPTITGLAEFIKRTGKPKESHFVPIANVEEKEYYPLTSAQERIFVLQQMDKEGITYNMPSSWILTGALDWSKLENTFSQLIQRHESLRTSFHMLNNETLQRIHPHVSFEIEKSSLTNFIRPFDLARAPLLRVGLLELADQKHLLWVDMHHIISDEMSMKILIQEFTSLYSGNTLSPLKIQYKDYAEWKAREKEKESYGQQTLFWEQQFQVEIPILDLPTDFVRPVIKSFAGSQIRFEITAEETRLLKTLAHEKGTTLYITLLAIFNVFLARLTGQEIIAVGTPTVGRRHAGLEKIVGMFVNTLVLIDSPIGQKRFIDFLTGVNNNTLAAFENQDYPFEELVEKVGRNRDSSRNPLFDIMFSWQDANITGIDIPGLKVIPQDYTNHTAKFDLVLEAMEQKEQLQFVFEYCTRLFKESTMQRFSGYLKKIISQIITTPTCLLSEIEIISEAEKKQILNEFNLEQEPPIFKTIPQLFAEQVEQTPDYIALHGCMIAWMDGEVGANRRPPRTNTDNNNNDNVQTLRATSLQVTYFELNRQADRLAGILIEQGIIAGDIVGIQLERSNEMIISILGILKAGAAYLPINPNQPETRTQFMLKDSNAKLTINYEFFKEEQQVSFLHHSSFIIQHSNHPCYIIYTSGSTGNPKGVAITHANFSPLIHWGYKNLGINKNDRVIQNLSYYFDWSVWEIFIALTTGASLHMISESILLNPEAEVEFILKNAITVLHITPTQFNYLLNVGQELSTLKYLFIGAEKLTVDLVERSIVSVNHDCRIFNMYGPTEATIISAVLEIDKAQYIKYKELTSVPIGRASAGLLLVVLNKYGQLCPVKIAGELYITGPGVANGYLNNPELTAEKFINKSFAGVQGELFQKLPLVYRTGDLARWLPAGPPAGGASGGVIEFLGRMDEQVKIRGFRIELGEIENRLATFPGISGCAAIAYERKPGEKYICAYFSAHEKIDLSELRNYLTGQLPGYMIPAYIKQLEKIPLNPNGKLDKKSLPLPEIGTNENVVAPKNDREKIIAAAWKEILTLDNVGIDDNFFELGGNSLDIVKVNQRLKKQLAKDISLMSLFRYPTVRTLAAYLDRESQTGPIAKSKQLKNKDEEIINRNREIAVIGMAGRFPGAHNIAEFWNNLKNGVESITFFSAEELIEAGIDPVDVNKPNYVRALGCMPDSEYFDGAFFGYTPLEIEVTDPQIRIFHECAWEAFEDAGYDPGIYDGRVGVYAGGESSSFWESLSQLSPLSDQIDSFTLGNLNNKDYLSARVSYRLNLRGPVVSIHTACSTGLTAIHFAVQGLLNSECEMALAGGARVNLPGKTGYLYQEGVINSPDGHCRAFDARAKGTVAGDGAGIVLLKSLAEAVADGDHIYAIIKGTAINNDGVRKVGFHAPSIDGESEAISSALYTAEVAPETIGYIETHGTGTELGDTVEIEALKLCFNTTNKKICALGSVKTNVGHLGCAAGVTGFIKTVLILKHRLIPPSLHFEKPNPKIDFENSPFYVNTRLRPWPETSEFPLRAGVSSFGIGGTNAHAILEAVNILPQKETPDRPYQLLLLSARTPKALGKIRLNLANHLKENPAVSLSDVAYTLQVGRKRFPVREKITCKDTNEAIQLLSVKINPYTAQPGDENRKVVFIFPGLGPQYVNMGLDIYQTEPYFRDEMDRCFEIAQSLGYNIKEILYPSSSFSSVSSVSSVAKVEIAQLVVFSFEYSLARLVMHWGIKPHALIGYSFGEYVAACLAGVFSPVDILKLLVARGKMISRLPQGTMLSVPFPVEEVLPLLPSSLSMAIDNGQSCVVSGLASEIDAFAQKMKEKKILVSSFESPFAGHSQMLDTILPEFAKEVAKIQLHEPEIPYISTVTGNWITVEDAKSPVYWVQQLRSAVYFVQGIRKILEDTQPLFLEIGPGRDMSALVNRETEDIKSINLVKHRGGKSGSAQQEMGDDYYLLDKLGRLWLYGVNIDWPVFHGDYPDHKRYRVPLPKYPFERQRYWHIIDDYRSGKYWYIKGAPKPRENRGSSPEMHSFEIESQKTQPTAWYERPQLSTRYIPPQNDIEQTLVKIWQHAFGIQEIGISDDFFELGGDSLKAINVLAMLHKETDRLVPLPYFFDNPTIEQLAAYSGTGVDDKKFISIPPLEKKEYYSMSSAQKRIYFFQQLDPRSIAYNNALVNTIVEDIDITGLSNIFKKLIARHEGLRTSFIEINGELVQRVHDHVEFEILAADTLPQQGQIRTFIQPFDLTRAPLLRVGLINRLLIVDMHHIISDGTSLAVLIEEFTRLYRGEELPFLRLQYKDYAAWQNREKDGVLSRQRKYWLDQFYGEIPILDLPYDYNRPANRTFAGKTMNFTVNNEETLLLNQVAADHGATLYMVLLGITGIFLNKLTGQETVVIGTPIAGRTHADLQRIIGMFINTLAMRIEPTGEKTVPEFLMEIKEKALNAFANQEFQYEELVEHLDIDRSSGRNPLFDTLFALQNVETRSISTPGLNLEPYPFDQGVAKFDLSFQCFLRGDGLSFVFEYSSELFKEETAVKLTSYFKKITSTVAQEPAQKIKDIEIISQAEKEQVLVQFNDTGREYPEDKTIHQLFIEQVEKTPDYIALHGCIIGWMHGCMIAWMDGEVARNVSLTYHQLNEQANR